MHAPTHRKFLARVGKIRSQEVTVPWIFSLCGVNYVLGNAKYQLKDFFPLLLWVDYFVAILEKCSVVLQNILVHPFRQTKHLVFGDTAPVGPVLPLKQVCGILT